MEDVLETYARPRDDHRPLVCLDEFCKQLVGETRLPIPAVPGQPARVDYEYERNGMCSIFMVYSPLESRRRVFVTQKRTAADYAQVLKELSDDIYPSAQKIVLVQDNLNTHSPASLYEAFAPAEALRLKQRFEWHYTPKHGSWLNMAEIEIGVAQRQCLDTRIDQPQVLRSELAAWEKTRNAAKATTDWQFKTQDARTKLRKLYPSIQLQ
jgi:hypothetical protein